MHDGSTSPLQKVSSRQNTRSGAPRARVLSQGCPPDGNGRTQTDTGGVEKMLQNHKATSGPPSSVEEYTGGVRAVLSGGDIPSDCRTPPGVCTSGAGKFHLDTVSN